MPGAEISVLLVDDHPVVRDGVTAALRGRVGIVVVGEAGSAREAVDLALRLRPAVVLVDLHMPGVNGVVAIRELGRVHPEGRCLVLTLDDEDESLFAAMAAGARGYLLKGAGGSEIEGAIRAAAAGELVFGAGVALAPKTVRNQLSSLVVKLGVPDRSAAAALARRAGLGRDDGLG